MTVGDILNYSSISNDTGVRLTIFSLTPTGAGVNIVTGTKTTPAITAHASDVLGYNDYFAYYPEEDRLIINIGA